MDEIPQIGLGTWQNKDPETCAECVELALETGYRHIDTAQAYGNEDSVGEGIERSSVDREDILLATKVWNTKLAYDDVLRSTRTSLSRLGVDYVDLLYIHWPAPAYDPDETLRALDELHDEGKVRKVAVSNFTPELVREAADRLDAPLFANQVETHPLLPQDELLSLADEMGFEHVAYSPLARGKVFDISEVGEVAEKHDASEAQVTLAWLIERGAKPIPKSETPEHIRDNYDALRLNLDDEDVEKISSIDDRERLIDPEFAPDW